MNLFRRFRSLFLFPAIALAVLLATFSDTPAQAECNVTGAPIATTGNIDPADPDQVGRLFRDGIGTTCIF
ncbi:MAG: hypothetical protein WBO68_01100, partial [Pyrinomonadaceae bacterium]